MDMLKKVVCLMVLCMVLISPCAEAITCGQVSKSLAPCLGYLKSGGAVPSACCSGVRNLNSAAKTTLDRQTACRCLIAAAKSTKGINPTNANNLPGACGVNIGYPISASTDCSKVQ